MQIHIKGFIHIILTHLFVHLNKQFYEMVHNNNNKNKNQKVHEAGRLRNGNLALIPAEAQLTSQ